MIRGAALPLAMLWLVACASVYDVGGGSAGGSATATETSTGATDGGTASATDGGTGACVDCEGSCVDISSDPDHCGGCEQRCSDDKVCIGGECTDPCDASCDPGLEICEANACVCRSGLTPCGEQCVDLGSNPAHCGACGNACPEACGNGACQPAACDGFPLACDGACVDPDSDPLHCGACGEACESNEACVAGKCEEGAHGMTWQR